ncbi:hypothetical protein HPB50_029566 [Hyalomma asiaticum]|nr:hypothetical protein HPB50_029566 [Hyalomma asiaticum]
MCISSRNFPNSIEKEVAEYASTRYMAALVSNQARHLLASATEGISEIAEEVATALVRASTTASAIVCDTQTAIHNFTKSRISKEALSIMVHLRRERDVHVIWTPARSFLPRNETSRSSSREPNRGRNNEGALEWRETAW